MTQTPIQDSITLSGHEVTAYYHQLRLMVAGERLPRPNAVSLLNEKTGRRRGPRYWLNRLEPAFNQMTSCRISP